MTAGCVMLCHGGLDRAEQVARHICAQGTPLALHVDSGTPVSRRRLAELAAIPGLVLAGRRRSRWGGWELVEASLGGALALLSRHPQLTHVCLISGSCLPLRPMAELDRFLAEHPGRDFIESVRIRQADWVVSGLQEERFRLRFPFRFREQRRLFDLATRVQRMLPEQWQRALPAGLDPCLGSQWWCLSRRTLEAILSDPGLTRSARYFRRVWIPDEAFFQSMARRHGRDVVSRTLTFAPFDRTGRPVTFYDDHAAELRGIGPDYFFVRKVWEGADRLYAERLGKLPAPVPSRRDGARRIAARAAVPQPLTPAIPRRGEPPGTVPYLALFGAGPLFPGLPRILRDAGRGPWIDTAFGPAARLNPAAHLANLLRDHRGMPVLSFGADSPPEAAWSVALDPLARIIAVEGGWVLPLAGGAGAEAQGEEFARLRRAEGRIFAALDGGDRRAALRRWTLEEALAAPDEIAEALGLPPDSLAVPQAAQMAEFLERMRDDGLNPSLSLGRGGAGARLPRGLAAR
ncbi:beta-1,6-N-acetylglucosaminyltransferase [Mangrovicoccus sp. HB161399]|uniref:beta-1,6-N-acetylglucosaminyltransferase n=1 Tax=Mangrovicoccus sp. HB161399 TaxID=2720392 RepID=UPI001555548F|nr:beta-1,6-N-acetylglucosaminyltransferase [Mangrovicoccus sp. HB161399]